MIIAAYLSAAGQAAGGLGDSVEPAALGQPVPPGLAQGSADPDAACPEPAALNPVAIAQAASALAGGELLGLPTETVYGLAADAEQPDAVARIFAAKGRPVDHPLIVHLADPAEAAHFAAHIPDFAQALMQAFWPGPLTLILPRRTEVAAAAAGGQAAVGLRCPSHPVAQAVLRAARQRGVRGVAAPSANQFGRVSPTTAAHVAGEFGADLLILDGGACTVGIESTIVDCSRGTPVLLRPGQISRAQIAQVCAPLLGDLPAPAAPLLHKDLLKDLPAPRASGTLASHYAPRATVRLFDAAALQAALARTLLASVAVYARSHAVWPPAAQASRPGLTLHWQRMPEDAQACAQELFAVLRQLDESGAAEIWVQTPPPQPDWEGVRDRLTRAAA